MTHKVEWLLGLLAVLIIGLIITTLLGGLLWMCEYVWNALL